MKNSTHLTNETKERVTQAWEAFCAAVIDAEKEHGAPLMAFFGEGHDIVDYDRFAASREGCGGEGGSDFSGGGAILIHLPMVDGFSQDGGGW